MTGAFAGPKQRQLRVATSRGLQQGLQILEKGTVTLRHASPPSTHSTKSLSLCTRLILLRSWSVSSSHFSESSSNGGTGEARGLRDRGEAASPDGHRFAGSPAATNFFVQQRT